MALWSASTSLRRSAARDQLARGAGAAHRAPHPGAGAQVARRPPPSGRWADIANIALALTAVTSAVATGTPRLGFLAEGARLATIASGVPAPFALARLVFSSRREERRDCRRAMEQL